MAVLSIGNDGNFERFLTSSTSQTLLLHHKFTIRPSTESRILDSSIYYYELLMMVYFMYCC